MGGARSAILSNAYPAYLQNFFWNYFKGDTEDSPRVYPRWCVEALRTVGVDLLAGRDSDSISVVDGSGAKWEYSEKMAVKKSDE
jgi:queuine tRNA-ribosyltransferase catalytic subunit